ncbi:MAG: site-specific DNA-methyltransferase [Culicoidibacterales bacterium]
MEKQTLDSLNLTAENISKLAELFPSAVSEGKINFETLKTLLGETVDDSNERYQFSWNGKHQAMQLAQTPSTGTLLPNQGKSKNWDQTDNVYIEGDNLEVLKLLQKSYFGKIKMIYIDPPYNTGKDFVYKDSFQDTIQNYKEQTNQTTKANAETSGRYHTDWLNMMYPRLMLARNLLTEDGVIFISIDDNEQANLKKMCDEIFGEDNFVADLIWTNKEGGGSSDSSYFRIKHEHILVYSKNKKLIEICGTDITNRERYTQKDEFFKERGNYYLQKLGMGSIQYSETLDYEILAPDGTAIYPKDNNSGKKACWRWSKDKYDWGIREGFIEIKKDSKNMWTVYTKQYMSCDNEGNFIIRTQRPFGVINDYSSTKASKMLVQMRLDNLFNYSKPYELIKYLLQRINNKNDIILDFFSGSATTAHAVMQLNAEDGGKRKYIMVQIPENTPEKSEAAKAGYTTIPEIAQERIRRAGELIINDDSIPQENRDNLDAGFKVFMLDSSNVKPFDSTQLFASAETFVEGRSELDICYELILKSGLALTTPIQQRDGIYIVDDGLLFISLADQITTETADAIINLADVDLNPRVIFKDTGFRDDATKLNVLRRLQTAGISEVRSV